ncbi:hypothetical protein [Dyella sp. GSA-30]|uniref:hypothetical protein n=1 Tax=Dyella sp. GSA-30 TaxID=2994496 RepID=UPI0024908071|nr:hypothetical protein [Dyella sp. GSA-30]BDU22442.1 hypothetical protein DYGSA30_38990 [Dyella sp. GSA-30]
MRVHRTLILTAGLTLSLAAKADDIRSEKDANLERFFAATHLTEAFKANAARARLDDAFDPLGERTSHLSGDEVAKVMASALRNKFTVEETRALADYYASGASQAITDRRPLTSAQQIAFNELYPAHKDVPGRMKSILASSEFQHRASESIRAYAASGGR